MILRVIVTTIDYAAAANVGGPALVTHQTFDVEATPELAACLEEGRDPEAKYVQRAIAGVEVRD